MSAGCGNPEVSRPSHRKSIPTVGMRDPQIIPYGSVAQVCAHIDCDAQAVGVWDTFEADGRVVPESVQDYGIIGIAEPLVHVV